MKLDAALFLGAGFSYPAGIPIMRELVAGFPKVLEDNERNVYRGMKELLPEIEKDFELLMECCHDLKEVPVGLVDRLAQRCYGEHFSDLICLAEGATQLEEHLKDYLRQSCTIGKGLAEYLYPFMAWLKKTGHGLDIFTLNYDLLVEGLCDEFYLSFTDGFLLNWQPELFRDPRFQICLYKLHGSFIWYQSKLGERVKVPFFDGRKEMEHLAKNEVVSMMVYPRRKKIEPFSDLLRMFRERLLTLRKLIVIGYSFRDEELLQLIQDGLRKNRKLQLEIVLPSVDGVQRLFEPCEQVSYFCGGIEEWIKRERYLEMVDTVGDTR